jgi:2-methylcitrate dehydratase PrpD
LKKLKKNNKIIHEIYQRSEFKKILKRNTSSTSTSPIKSNYAQNTTSAAATAGRGGLAAANLAGKGIGAAAKGLGKVGGFLKGIIPGTN